MEALSTEMGVLRRLARKSRLEKGKNENIKEIMGVKGKSDIVDIIEKKKTTMVLPRQEDAKGENTEINFGMGTSGEAKNRTS
jgi:hypothetical protein